MSKHRYVQASIQVVAIESPMEESFTHPGREAPSSTTFTQATHTFHISVVEEVSEESVLEIALEEALAQAMAKRQGNEGDAG